MCLIIDNDVVQKVLVAQQPDYSPVLRALTARRHCLVYGGELREQYQRNHEVARKIVSLDKAGAARAISDDLVASEIMSLANAGLYCRSDDPCVIALARVSCARVLCSADIDLQRDFTNPRLVNNPRGKVYKRANSHARLVSGNCACKRRR
jgi:hypothetical protein